MENRMTHNSKNASGLPFSQYMPILSNKPDIQTLTVPSTCFRQLPT